MTHEQHGATAASDLRHLAQTFPLELHVTDGEHLVHDEDFRFEMRRNSEGKPHIHARGIAFDRRIKKLFDLGESYDRVKLPTDLPTAHAEDRAVQVDVLATRQL